MPEQYIKNKNSNLKDDEKNKSFDFFSLLKEVDFSIIYWFDGKK